MSEWIVEAQFVLDPSQSWGPYHGMNRNWSKERAEASCARLQKAYPKKRRFRVKEKCGSTKNNFDTLRAKMDPEVLARSNEKARQYREELTIDAREHTEQEGGDIYD